MNRLLVSCASKSLAPSLRSNPATPSHSAVRFLGARQFSDSAADEYDDEIKTGTVVRYAHTHGFGFIRPDSVDKKTVDDKDLLFAHTSEIKKHYQPELKFSPGMGRGLRVQFKVGPPQEGKRSKQALEITLEGGKMLPPVSPGYLEKHIKRQKAEFGAEVFDIFSTSESQTDLETRIVAAYDKVKTNIDNQTAKVEEVMRPYREEEDQATKN